MSLSVKHVPGAATGRSAATLASGIIGGVTATLC